MEETMDDKEARGHQQKLQAGRSNTAM